MTALILLSFLARSLNAAEESYSKLPDGALLVLPKDAASEWQILPGMLKKLHKAKLAFGVGPNGKVCLAAAGRVFFYPELALTLTTKVPIQEFIWLAEGNMLVHTGNELGFLKINEDRNSETLEEKKKGLLNFTPLFKLPYKQSRLFPGIGDFFYVVGRNETEKRNEISAWDLAGEKVPAKPLYATDAPISAVAGSPQKTYFATGRGVFVLEKGASASKAVYLHPREDIRDLVYHPDAGLFYTTDNAAGYIGEKEQFEFLVYPGVELRLRKKALYIRMGSVANGIMKVTGPEHFADLRLDPPK